ncbi:MAG: hypothetical protein QRY74_01340 [Chlamydia sp.]
MNTQKKVLYDFDSYFDFWRTDLFQKKEYEEKLEAINRALLGYIQKSASPCFLLPTLFEFIDIVNKNRAIDGEYSLSLFELWLNRWSGIALEENLLIRGKIVGRYIPREEYQLLFPIGMNSVHKGPHFVAAHLSPDIDTTVASFLGWLDAFGARVSDGIHYWCLPNGFNDGYLTTLFKKCISQSFWSLAPKKSSNCAITGIDLLIKPPQSPHLFDLSLEEIQNCSSTSDSIDSSLLTKSTLGTASLRDFSNLEEAKLAAHIDVISIVDHHKSSISTTKPATLILGDAQSSNTLLSEISATLNARWRRSERGPFFVDPARELFEQTISIIAILDDTDLLNKASRRDVLTLKESLNRIIALSHDPKETLISFDAVIEDSNFVANATHILLTNPKLYSMYQEIYDFREQEIEKALILEAKGEETILFGDTKEQNGVCRIGQIKLFSANISSYHAQKWHLMEQWVQKAGKIHSTKAHMNFFLQMISTVPGALEAFSGNSMEWKHQDEIWIFSPDLTKKPLTTFLSNFLTAMKSLPIQITFSETGSQIVQNFIKESHANYPIVHEKDLPTDIIQLSFPAGSINSRKAQISPFLPSKI